MDLIALVRLRGYFRAAQGSLVAVVRLTGGNLLFPE